jgi:AcrR family transcriptional regulator
MSGAPGRPLSAELSQQLVDVAVDILAEDGWGKLNSDRVAARARAGKAGIYRRWPSMAALARHAVGGFRLVPAPADTGTLRGDLLDLVACWTRPLSREERAAASLVGAARHDELLREGLDEALVRPLAVAVGVVGARAAERGQPVDDDRLALFGSVLEAFWWQRFTGDAVRTEEQLERLVDDVLLPVLAPVAEVAAA